MLSLDNAFSEIDVLDFLPLSNVSYSGGIISTDWYNEGTASNESIKITVRFLSNEIRADGLKVTVYNKSCISNEGVQNCSTQIDEASQIGQELKLAILKKAAMLEKEDKNKKKK